MRLLPRTVRGTWRLAGAVWLAGSAALWWAAPIVPRAEWRLPKDTAVLGFAAEPGTVLVQQQKSSPGVDHSPRYALDLLDAETGRFRGRLIDPHEPLTVLGRSNDGLYWVLAKKLGQPPLLRLDTVERRVEPLAAEEGVCPPHDQCELSPDGKLFAFQHPREEGVVVLWDVVANRRHGELRGVKFPLAFAADGHSLAVVGATAANEPPAVRVFDLPGLASLLTLRVPDGQGVLGLRLSDNGTWIAAGLSPQVIPQSDGLAIALGQDLICWETVTGTACLREKQVVDFEVTTDNRVVWTRHWFGPEGSAMSCNLATRVVQSCMIPNNVGDVHSDGFRRSPDGQTILIGYAATSTGPVERLANQLRLPWPFAPSRGLPCARLFDATSGRPLGDITGLHDHTSWAPDGRLLLLVDADDTLRVSLWDVPPRKSMTWFTAGAAAWALPIALLARRCVRRLAPRGN